MMNVKDQSLLMKLHRDYKAPSFRCFFHMNDSSLFCKIFIKTLCKIMALLYNYYCNVIDLKIRRGEVFD